MICSVVLSQNRRTFKCLEHYTYRRVPKSFRNRILAMITEKHLMGTCLNITSLSNDTFLICLSFNACKILEKRLQITGKEQLKRIFFSAAETVWESCSIQSKAINDTESSSWRKYARQEQFYPKQTYFFVQRSTRLHVYTLKCYVLPTSCTISVLTTPHYADTVRLANVPMSLPSRILLANPSGW